ncbi:hypothetical protein C1H46_017234 [Malus baccata]|uniref:Phospholipase/carboxylesterase/thioesterase domain-containing protein n=1 Tax=Malus baccata TaxID=106549 RepID=A0A540MEK2_MALBA|nr:hypothetical protein C1H46_017234 [Malus baccata]
MSSTGPSVGSGGRTARRAFEFGRTYVVRPKGKHQATVVWLHGLGDNGSRTLSKKLEVDEAARRAASIPLLLCHGKSDDVVPYKFGEKSSQTLSSTGFQNVTFKSYNGLGHYTIPEEMDEVCAWLRSKLGLDGTSS